MTREIVELGEYPGTVVHQTEAAKLIDFGGEEPVWVPKSQINSELPGVQVTTFVIPTWWAIQNGLE